MKVSKARYFFAFLCGPSLFFSFIIVAKVLQISVTFETKFVIFSNNQSEAEIEPITYLTAFINPALKSQINVKKLSIYILKTQKTLAVSTLNWINEYYLIIAESKTDQFENMHENPVIINYDQQSLWDFLINNLF